MCLGNIWPILKLSVWSLEKWLSFLFVCYFVCLLVICPPQHYRGRVETSIAESEREERGEWKSREAKELRRGQDKGTSGEAGELRTRGEAQLTEESIPDNQITTQTLHSQDAEGLAWNASKLLRFIQFDPLNIYENAFISARRSGLAKILIY